MHLYPCVHVCVYVCMFICAVQSFYFMRVRVYGRIGSGVGFSFFMVSACFWRGRLCFGRGGDRGFCLVCFSIFAGVRVVGVCVLVYARTHTQTTWVLDVSPGVGRTPGEPEESRSTKAQYTCRPYRCTQYICEIGRASDRDASGGRRREYRHQYKI